jgi:hypothetical protein
MEFGGFVWESVEEYGGAFADVNTCLVGAVFSARLSGMLAQAADAVGGVLARAKTAPASWQPTLTNPNRKAVGFSDRAPGRSEATRRSPTG